MTGFRRPVIGIAFAALAALGACAAEPAAPWLGAADRVAPGVEFYRSNDESLVDRAGPISVFLLKIDTGLAHVASVLSNDRVLDTETVPDMAQRHQALAAVNGGFFNRDNGEPTGVLKVAGELVSDATAQRGAVVILAPPNGPTAVAFDRLAVKMAMTVHVANEQWSIPIDGVDTTRERGRLMLYTPAYHADTDTAPTGTEWVLDGDPLRVVTIRRGAGHTPIPPRGAVLSFGGLTVTDELAAVEVGAEVRLTRRWNSAHGLASEDLEAATHIVAGAGLLRRGGVTILDWKNEGLALEAFVDARHPRTLIGKDAKGAVWLAVADGRQSDYSIGMRFSDMQRLADRLGLTDALNLDGGGSATMVVRGQVVNRPSDPGGARPVADAIVVTRRSAAGGSK
jgi:Phosphodiester glycosidase